MATEKRLIDLEKIKPIDFPSTEMDGLDVVRYLNTLPTVDAVEVVRCKDCFANGCCSIQIDLDMGDEGYCPKGRKETQCIVNR